MVDILEVLEDLHGHNYIHNDIQPGNIVKVGDKFRLIDFGLAAPIHNTRDIAPRSFPKGHIIFASHNWGKYLGAGDDLEALCYTVSFMHNRNKGYWRAVLGDPLKAFPKKTIQKTLGIFEGLPHTFQEFFRYVYDLDITATPDYKDWHRQFMLAADLPSSPRKRPNKMSQKFEGNLRRRLQV